MRVYTARGQIASYAGNDDFLQIQCAADKVIKLYRFTIGMSNSETDDSSSIELVSRTAAKTGGTGINARPRDPGDAADSATILQQPTTGSPTDTVEESWPISMLAGLQIIWMPEERPVIAGQDVWAFKFTSAITAITLEYNITFEEIG